MSKVVNGLGIKLIVVNVSKIVKTVKAKTGGISIKTRLYLVLGIIIVASACVVTHVVVDQREKIDVPKIQALLARNDCSPSALSSVSSERPNHNQLNPSALLLNYRGFCLVTNGHYKLANVQFEQLKTYYMQENEMAGVRSVEHQISMDDYASTHNGQPIVSSRPELTPDQAKQIQAFYEDNK